MKKNLLITGATSPIILFLVKIISTNYDQIILITSNEKSRDQLKLQLLEYSNINVINIDLISYSSIYEGIKIIKSMCQTIDCLILHAGVGEKTINIKEKTKENFESIVGINFLGNCLIYKMTEDLFHTKSKIIFTGSRTLELDNFDLSLFFRRCPGVSYGFSNLCRMMFMKDLSKKKYIVCGIIPGPVKTKINSINRNHIYWPIPEEFNKISISCIHPRDAAKRYANIILEPNKNKINGKIFLFGNEYIPKTSIYHNNILIEKLINLTDIFLNIKIEKKTNVCGPIKLYNKYNIHDILKEENITEENILNGVNVSFVNKYYSNKTIYNICTDKNILKHVSNILGDQFTLFRSVFMISSPNETKVNRYHIDKYPNIIDVNSKIISLWISFSEVDNKNGFKWIIGSSSNNKNGCICIETKNYGNKIYKVSKLAQRGYTKLSQNEFISFDDTVVHKYIKNISGKIRYALVVRFTTSDYINRELYDLINIPPIFIIKKKEKYEFKEWKNNSKPIL